MVYFGYLNRKLTKIERREPCALGCLSQVLRKEQRYLNGKSQLIPEDGGRPELRASHFFARGLFLLLAFSASVARKLGTSLFVGVGLLKGARQVGTLLPKAAVALAPGL